MIVNSGLKRMKGRRRQMRDRLIELLKKGQADYSRRSLEEIKKILCEKHKYNSETDKVLSLWEELADYLLANGVIVPPVKVGDAYYTIQRYCNTDPFETEKEPVHPWDCDKYCGRNDCSFSEYRIEEHRFGSISFILRVEKDIGKTVFLTREEAEQALKGDKDINVLCKTEKGGAAE